MLPALGTTKLNKLIGLPSDKVKKKPLRREVLIPLN